ncbi:hypothetical protein E6O75_ATG06825 [Venturia nashicola]|uniref:Rhodopsin domain-containing protein n=1 Tax=Venturia nashicola TaxID=86259 RepID=A0A4Z1PAP7_9PEZI|nr:hypothetical protein E6O75_ATG06825 [Venturia nashicola]
MKLPPPSVLRTWPKPNYANPTTRGNTLIIFNSVLLGFMTIILGLRLYTRLILNNFFGWDDGFIICSYMSTVLMNVTVGLGSERYGWNRHAWDIPPSMGKTAFHVAFYAKLCFLFAGFFTAMSLLAFYYRLIQKTSVRWFRITLHCSVVFNIVAWLPFVFTEIFVCIPVYAYWSFPEPAGSRCMREGPATMVGGLVKIVVDLLIASLPIPLVMRMDMQKKQRYMVTLLLGLGYIVCVAGAVRAYYTWKSFYNTNDASWDQYPAFVAAALENNLAIICACVPTIRPLFPHLFGGPVSRIKNWMSSKASSNPNSNADRSGSTTHKRSISAPFNFSSSSRDNKLIIRQDQVFELTAKSIHDDVPSLKEPDYFHFGPLMDERGGFHAF